MTPDHWFGIAQIAVGLIAAILVFYWDRERKLSQQISDQRLTAIERSLDRASEKSSELAGDVQHCIGRLDRMPEDLRKTFLSIERSSDLIESSQRDRRDLWIAIRELKGGKGASGT